MDSPAKIKELLCLPPIPFIELKSAYIYRQFGIVFRIRKSPFSETELYITQQSLEFRDGALWTATENEMNWSRPGSPKVILDSFTKSINRYLKDGWTITSVDKEQWIKHFGECRYEK